LLTGERQRFSTQTPLVQVKEAQLAAVMQPQPLGFLSRGQFRVGVGVGVDFAEQIQLRQLPEAQLRAVVQPQPLGLLTGGQFRVGVGVMVGKIMAQRPLAHLLEGFGVGLGTMALQVQTVLPVFGIAIDPSQQTRLVQRLVPPIGVQE
jgi:hypothetical protein